MSDKLFYVLVKEVAIVEYEVHAKSKKEAEELVANDKVPKAKRHVEFTIEQDVIASGNTANAAKPEKESTDVKRFF